MPHSQPPRRFGRVLEFDRNGPPLTGTPEQQAAIRATLIEAAPFGSRLDRTLFVLDVRVNRQGRHFVPVGFADYEAHGLHLLGFTWRWYLQLGAALLPDHVASWFVHELGHLVGWHCFNPVDTSEDWAVAFHDWVQAGSPAGPVWDRIDAAAIDLPPFPGT